MSTTIADGVNNPLIFDDRVAPPARSALAILNAEAEELSRMSAADLLARARAMRRTDPDLSTNYGRPVTDEDLTRAAEVLGRAEGRLLAELLDFPAVPFDLGTIPEMNELVAGHVARLGAEKRPEVADVAIVAQLLQDVVPAPRPLETAPRALEAPTIPPIAEILSSIV